MLGVGRVRRAGRRQVRLRPGRPVRRPQVGLQTGRRSRHGTRRGRRRLRPQALSAEPQGCAAHAAGGPQAAGLQDGPHVRGRSRRRCRSVSRAGRRGRQQGVLVRTTAGGPPPTPPPPSTPAPAAARGHRQRPGRGPLDERRVQVAVRRGRDHGRRRRRTVGRRLSARRVDVRPQRVHQKVVCRSESKYFYTIA